MAILARRLFSSSSSSSSSKYRLPCFPRSVKTTRSPPPISFSSDFKSCCTLSRRRIHGVMAVGQSLMPWHTATASASLVSMLQIDDTPVEGRFSGYISPI